MDFQAGGGGTEAPTKEHRGHGGLRLLFSHINEESPGEDRDIEGPQGFSPSLGWGCWHGRRWWSGLGSARRFPPCLGNRAVM